MSYRSILGPSAMLLTLAAPTAAAAADAPRAVMRDPVPAAIYSHDWAGFYIGAHAGGLWGDIESDFEGGATHAETDIDGFLGGGQLGYNFQNGNWVFGIEGDVSFSGADATFFPGTVIATPADLEWLATIRGRIGHTAGATLYYVTGGVAFGEIEMDIEGGATTDSNTHTGYVIGGGIEHAFTQSLSGKIEYNYVDLGQEDYFDGGLPDAEMDAHVIKAGVNWHFNSGY